MLLLWGVSLTLPTLSLYLPSGFALLSHWPKQHYTSFKRSNIYTKEHLTSINLSHILFTYPRPWESPSWLFRKLLSHCTCHWPFSLAYIFILVISLSIFFVGVSWYVYGEYVSVYHCLHVCGYIVCACVCMHMCTHLWTPKSDFWCLSQLLSTVFI